MRKTVIANSVKIKRAMSLAFEHTFRNYKQGIAEDCTEIAYNMNQTSTSMSKERIASRLKKHMDTIKARKERIKILALQQKNAKDPEAKRTFAQRIFRLNERIAKNNEAIAYYKKLSSLKPKPTKVAPTAR